LTVLEVLGAVTRKTKIGTVVSEVDFGVVASIIRFLVVRSDKDLGDLFEARRIFEVNLLPLVYDNWTDETKIALNEALARYAQAIRNGEDGVAEDAAFHEALVDCSNNSFIRHYAAMIRGFFNVPRVTTPLTMEQKQLTLSEHSQIVALLTSRDLAQAQRLLHRHLSRYVERGIVSSEHRP
jgi:GntR family transcriptional repressor for pyruvate dehydrogenase complex